MHKTPPYALISDLHFHNWSAYSTVDAQGVNSRLKGLLGEVHRAATELKSFGGDTIFIAGDVFHVRGKVAPSVFNSVQDALQRIATGMSMKIYILAGNHDLESEKSTWLGSAVSGLENHAKGILTVSELPCMFPHSQNLSVNRTMVRMVPWNHDLNELKKTIQAGVTPDTHLIIHAPVNGVIKGLPDAGLDPAWLASLGYDAVFAGHYHNHKEFPGNVFSIGALAHHTWSDVGSKAGYLLVWPGDGHSEPTKVQYRASHLPNFVDLDPDMDDDEMGLAADGHYVRAYTEFARTEEVESIREALLKAGAKGVQIISKPKSSAPARATPSAATLAGSTSGVPSIPQSVENYVQMGTFKHRPELSKLCAEILRKAQEE